MDHSLKVGESAFWGRIFGTFGKTAIGCVNDRDTGRRRAGLTESRGKRHCFDAH